MILLLLSVGQVSSHSLDAFIVRSTEAHVPKGNFILMHCCSLMLYNRNEKIMGKEAGLKKEQQQLNEVILLMDGYLIMLTNHNLDLP